MRGATSHRKPGVGGALLGQTCWHVNGRGVTSCVGLGHATTVAGGSCRGELVCTCAEGVLLPAWG